MFSRTHLTEGMTVRSADGEKLGKVFAIGESEFQVEKGLFFPKDYLARYADIADIRDGEVLLRHGREDLRRAGWSAEGWGAREATPMAETAAGAAGTGATREAGLTSGLEARHDDLSLRERHGRTGKEGDVAVPVVEEELDVVKRERESGEVRIHKTVETELRTLEVPVRQEKVVVERVAAPPASTRAPAEAFREEDIRVPVHAEEVEVRKRPVVKEEVRVRRSATEREQRVAADVRKEHVDVRTEGEVDETSRRSPSTPGALGTPEDDTKTRW